MDDDGEFAECNVGRLRTSEDLWQSVNKERGSVFFDFQWSAQQRRLLVGRVTDGCGWGEVMQGGGQRLVLCDVMGDGMRCAALRYGQVR